MKAREFEEWAARRRAVLAYRKSGKGWHTPRRAPMNRYRGTVDKRIGL
jgi:hypothetical protein